MANIPAYCPKCKKFFRSLFNIRGGTGTVQFSGLGTACSICGGPALIPDGIYGAVEGTLTFFNAAHPTHEEALKLNEILRQAFTAQWGAEQVRQAIEAQVPRLSPIAKYTPTNAAELAAYIGLVLTAIGLIIAGYAALKDTPTPITMKSVTDIVINNHFHAAAPGTPSAHAPKDSTLDSTEDTMTSDEIEYILLLHTDPDRPELSEADPDEVADIWDQLEMRGLVREDVKIFKTEGRNRIEQRRFHRTAKGSTRFEELRKKLGK
jgi:hypothetical protein